MKFFRMTNSSDKKESYALVIDGKTLVHVLESHDGLRQLFLEVCLKCDAVLCCRMTPSQKAEVSFCLFLELKK
jgi:magnesium-transporting ATPase (P-type)